MGARGHKKTTCRHCGKELIAKLGQWFTSRNGATYCSASCQKAGQPVIAIKPWPRKHYKGWWVRVMWHDTSTPELIGSEMCGGIKKLEDAKVVLQTSVDSLVRDVEASLQTSHPRTVSINLIRMDAYHRTVERGSITTIGPEAAELWTVIKPDGLPVLDPKGKTPEHFIRFTNEESAAQYITALEKAGKVRADEIYQPVMVH